MSETAPAANVQPLHTSWLERAFVWAFSGPVIAGTEALEANESDNIAKIEALVGQGVTYAEATATTLLSKVTLPYGLNGVALVLITEGLNAADGLAGSTDAGDWYAKGVAFLIREEGYIGINVPALPPVASVVPAANAALGPEAVATGVTKVPVTTPPPPPPEVPPPTATNE